MGTSFFKGKAPSIGGGNPGLEARSIGSLVSSGRGAGIGAQKELNKAEAIGKMGAKPLKRSAAYPKGPAI